MTQLQNLLGEDGVRWALWGGIGLVALLALLLIIVVLKRVFAPAFNLSSAVDRRGRPPRLGVTDFFNLDRTGRRLVIVRRDNVEHLVMVGGPNDVVIETNIVRGMRPELATMDSAGWPTLQPRQIDNGGSDAASASAFETGLPQRDFARPASPQSPPAAEIASMELRAPPRNAAQTAVEPRIEDVASPAPRPPDIRVVEPRFVEPPPAEPPPAMAPAPQPVEPPLRAAPMRQPPRSTPERQPDAKGVEIRVLPELRPAKPVPPPPPAQPFPAPAAQTDNAARAEFQMPDFEELAALAKDTSRNPAKQQQPQQSPAADLAPAPLRSWPGPAQPPAPSVVPAPQEAAGAETAASDAPTPVAEASAKDTPARQTPAKETPAARELPKRASFEDVSRRLQEALRRPQSLTTSAITTSTARTSVSTAPIQPAPFSPIPPAGEAEAPHMGGEPDASADDQAKATSGGAIPDEKSDELDLEQEMARLLGRAPGARE